MSKQPEKCRGCGRELIMSHDGFHARTAENIEAKTCFYGGFVCSRRCDVKACIEMESSMPGAGFASRPGDFSMQQIHDNWDEESI